MKKIGVLSDTHGFLHHKIPDILDSCDEIWHAGDIGSVDLFNTLNKKGNLRAVYGNIDGHDIRNMIPEIQQFNCENVKVIMVHIGGIPGRYSKVAYNMIKLHKPDLFVCGHSHILKIMYDKKHDLLYVNPGAAGRFGSHKVITVITLIAHNGKLSDLEVIELNKN